MGITLNKHTKYIFIIVSIMLITIIFFTCAFHQRHLLSQKYNDAKKYIKQEKYNEAIKCIESIPNYENYKDSVSLYEDALNGKKYKQALQEYNSGDYESAKKIFEELEDYKESERYFAKSEVRSIKISQEIVYDEAYNLYKSEKYHEALEEFVSLNDYKDSKNMVEKCQEIIDRLQNARSISAGIRYSLGVTSQGKIVTAGSNIDERCNVNSWTDIISIDGFGYLTLGLKKNGKTVIAGNMANRYNIDISTWNHIIDIATGEKFIVGLKSDGTVLAQGHNGDGQLDVNNWLNVKDIAAGWSFSVGLTKNHELLYSGYDNGQMEEYIKNKELWKNVVAISANGGGANEKCKGGGHTVGLNSDGTVVAIGDNKYGQCNVYGKEWKNITAIAAGDWYTVGLKSDGTVLITGENTIHNAYIDQDFYNWKDIVDIAAGFGQTLGLKKDGTVVAIGYNNEGERDDTIDWNNICIINKN